MKIIAIVNERDSDMIELYSDNEKYMLGAVHLDSFMPDEDIFKRLDAGKRTVLNVSMVA